MAEKAKPNGNDQPPANAEGMMGMLRDAAENMNALESKTVEIQERHKAELKPLKKQIRELRSKVKAAEFDLEDFDYWRRIWAQNDEHRAKTIDGIQMLVKSLDIGDILDIEAAIAASRQTSEAPADAPDA